MKTRDLYKSAGALLLIAIAASCTNLDQHVYSVVPQADFWKTPEQIAAGVAPGYQALTAIPDGNVFSLQEVTSDEQIIPTRGGDWYDGGKWQALWLHTWTPTTTTINDAWNDIYNGVGRVNFALNSLDNLKQKPDNIGNIEAELKTLRAYFYYLAMDLYGNIPLVTSFNTNPDSVTNSSRKEAFNFIEKEVKDNIDLLNTTVNASTYGKVTKWMAFALLAKLYLNAQVYTGQPRWQDCMKACDSVIASGDYSLSPEYFDNFSVNNEGSVENIFVVPFDKINIGGNNWENQTLHYQNQINFQLSGGTWNGYCAGDVFYDLFDTTSVYTTKGGNVYRTYLDQRSGQWLIGQQYSTPYTYPPDKNVLYHTADASLKLTDIGTGLSLVLTPHVETISDPASDFRLAGVRNIKYFPEAGTAGNQSNDMVLFRYADILLMKAECELRLGVNAADALDLVNQVRERAYSGNKSHDWTMSDLTLDNLLAERGRELAWEMSRRQDLIRYEVASGKSYFSAARKPDKKQDASDGHLRIFPIPAQQISANHNLKQNPGY
jgi:hypothetical protein